MNKYITYNVFDNTNDKRYYNIHKLAKKELIEKDNDEDILSYQTLLYKKCNGNIKFIKRVLIDIKKYEINNLMDIYPFLNEYIIQCFRHNQFKYVKQIKI
jgi:hypothetical protein